MAFEIGQRVTSKFTGTGTVTGELHKDEDRVCFQEVSFDNPSLGVRDYEIRKLIVVDDGEDASQTK